MLSNTTMSSTHVASSLSVLVESSRLQYVRAIVPKPPLLDAIRYGFHPSAKKHDYVPYSNKVKSINLLIAVLWNAIVGIVLFAVIALQCLQTVRVLRTRKSNY